VVTYFATVLAFLMPIMTGDATVVLDLTPLLYAKIFTMKASVSLSRSIRNIKIVKLTEVIY
jgi:hypothetical protein